MKPSYKNKRGDSRQGGKKFSGGGARWKSNSFDREPRQMYDAVCSECGNDAQVPFKPNGKKPVKCNNCFKRDDGFAPKRFEPGAFGRGRPNKFDSRSAPQFDSKKIEARLDAIENKLDALIEALSDIGEEEAAE